MPKDTAPVDVSSPPYTGNVGMYPAQFVGTNSPKQELARCNREVPSASPTPQTKDVMQESTAIAYNTTSTANKVAGGDSRSSYDGVPI